MRAHRNRVTYLFEIVWCLRPAASRRKYHLSKTGRFDDGQAQTQKTKCWKFIARGHQNAGIDRKCLHCAPLLWWLVTVRVVPYAHYDEHFRSRQRGRWSTHECKKEEWRCERGTWARVMGRQFLVFIFQNGSEHRCGCHNRSIFVNRCHRVFIFKFVPCNFILVPHPSSTK